MCEAAVYSALEQPHIVAEDIGRQLITYGRRVPVAEFKERVQVRPRAHGGACMRSGSEHGRAARAWRPARRAQGAHAPARQRADGPGACRPSTRARCRSLWASSCPARCPASCWATRQSCRSSTPSRRASAAERARRGGAGMPRSRGGSAAARAVAWRHLPAEGFVGASASATARLAATSGPCASGWLGGFAAAADGRALR